MRSWNARRLNRQALQSMGGTHTRSAGKGSDSKPTFLEQQREHIEKKNEKSNQKFDFEVPYQTLDILNNDKFQGSTSVFLLYVPLTCVNNKVTVTSKALMEYLYYGLIEEDKLVGNFLMEISELVKLKTKLDSDLLNIPSMVLRDSEGNVLSYEIQEQEKENLLDKLIKELNYVEMAMKYQEDLLQHHIQLIKSTILRLEPGPIDRLTSTRNWKIIFNSDSKYNTSASELDQPQYEKNFQFLENLLINKTTWTGLFLSLGGDLPSGEYIDRPWAGRLELGNFGIEKEEIEQGALKNNKVARHFLDLVLKKTTEGEEATGSDEYVDKPIIIDQKPYAVNLVGTRLVRLPDGVGLSVQVTESISKSDPNFADTLSLNSERILYALEDNGNKNEVYYGEYELGRREGYGVAINNDSIYYGNFHNNLRRGTGRLELGDGTTIIGQFGLTHFSSISDPELQRLYLALESVQPEEEKKKGKESKKQDSAQSTTTLPSGDPSAFEGRVPPLNLAQQEYLENRAAVSFPYSFYEEQFSNPYLEGDFNGPVEIFFSDGGYFKGTMVNGVIEGPGDYQSGIGEILSGPFTKNRLHCKDYPSRMKSNTFSNLSASLASSTSSIGQSSLTSSAAIGSLSSVSSSGFYQSPTGEQYLGSFEHGVPHGWGYYRTNKGDSYEGTWNYGQRHGRGVSKFSQPDKKLFGKYNGYFRYDYKFGHGSLYSGRVDGIEKAQIPRNDGEKSSERFKINNINKLDNWEKFSTYAGQEDQNEYDELEKKKLLNNLKSLLKKHKTQEKHDDRLFPTTTETITSFLVEKEKKIRLAQEKFHTLDFKNYSEKVPVYTSETAANEVLPELQVTYDSVYHGFVLGNKIMTSGCIMPINFKNATSDVIEDETRHGEYRAKTEEDIKIEQEEERIKLEAKKKMKKTSTNSKEPDSEDAQAEESEEERSDGPSKYIKPFYPSILSSRFAHKKKAMDTLLRLETQNLMDFEAEVNNLLSIQTYLRVEMAKKKLKFFHQQLHYTKNFIKKNFEKTKTNKRTSEENDTGAAKLKTNLKVQESVRASRLHRLKKINAVSHFNGARISRLRQDKNEIVANNKDKIVDEDDFDFFSSITSTNDGLPSVYDPSKNLETAQVRIKQAEILHEAETKVNEDQTVLPIELVEYEHTINNNFRADQKINSNFVSNVLSYMEETRERQRFLKYDAMWQRAEDSYEDYKKRIQKL